MPYKFGSAAILLSISLTSVGAFGYGTFDCAEVTTSSGKMEACIYTPVFARAETIYTEILREVFMGVPPFGDKGNVETRDNSLRFQHIDRALMRQMKVTSLKHDIFSKDAPLRMAQLEIQIRRVTRNEGDIRKFMLSLERQESGKTVESKPLESLANGILSLTRGNFLTTFISAFFQNDLVQSNSVSVLENPIMVTHGFSFNSAGSNGCSQRKGVILGFPSSGTVKSFDIDTCFRGSVSFDEHDKSKLSLNNFAVTVKYQPPEWGTDNLRFAPDEVNFSQPQINLQISQDGNVQENVGFFSYISTQFNQKSQENKKILGTSNDKAAETIYTLIGIKAVRWNDADIRAANADRIRYTQNLSAATGEASVISNLTDVENWESTGKDGRGRSILRLRPDDLKREWLDYNYTAKILQDGAAHFSGKLNIRQALFRGITMPASFNPEQAYTIEISNNEDELK